MSETSPPMPMMEVELKGRRRLTSVKRAREPYDAEDTMISDVKEFGEGRCRYLDCLLQ
jgi:hypothetical protein